MAAQWSEAAWQAHHPTCLPRLLGDAQAALSAYEATLGFDFRYSATHFYAGNAHMRLGELSSALLACSQAIACNPDFADALIAHGKPLESAYQTTEPEQCRRNATARVPSNCGVHASLGGFLLRAHLPNEAFETQARVRNYHAPRA